MHTCLSACTFDDGRRNVRPFATGTLAQILVWEVSVRLQKALYGHPLASAFWDKYLRSVLVNKLGLVSVEGHPSVYRCPRIGLLAFVHVDDVLVAGPSEKHMEIDEVESLNQFIGKDYILGNDTCTFDMTDYCQQAVDLYV